YAWWTEAEEFVLDSNGEPTSTGGDVAVAPGWYEIDTEVDWMLGASPAGVPSGNGAFSQTFVTLSHSLLGAGIRGAMVLDTEAVPNTTDRKVVHVASFVRGAGAWP